MSIAILSGAIANKPLNGGATWTRLSYLLGLKKLGFDVYFVEQIPGAPTSLENRENLAYFNRVMAQFDLSECSALVSSTSQECYGMTYKQLLEVADAADLLINITGHLTLDAVKRPIRRKVYLDLDPGFTQFWHEAGNAGAHLGGHDFYFSVGENIGRPGCSIPTSGIRWLPTRQPVVLDYWPAANCIARKRFTTIASWRGAYGPIQQGAVTLGLKVHEFRKFVGLPFRARASFEIALDIHPAEIRDLRLLQDNRWQVVDPRKVVPDPLAFRTYVQESGAEFSVAQGIYVETRSGWFSDRTVRYLASGKPAVVQDTGFSDNYPTGDGLVSFRNLEQAVAGVEKITREYDKHCRAARELAETYFDSNKVLGRLLDDVGVSA
jgi:hypothetical protein